MSDRDQNILSSWVCVFDTPQQAARYAQHVRRHMYEIAAHPETSRITQADLDRAEETGEPLQGAGSWQGPNGPATV